ncbi:MAG: polyprenyl synthetase family protein, partial [Candidatus Bathyarchaeia archaeon]
MSWEEAVKGYCRLIEEELRSRLSSLKRQGEAYHPYIGGLYGNLEQYVFRRGVRLASFTAFLTYKGYGGLVDDRIEAVCAGLELYRHSILIHDDLVDKDDVRRGGAAFHKLVAEPYSERLGEGVAVFVGNSLFALAEEAILNSGFEASKTKQVAGFLADAYRQVNESQVLDLLFEYRKPSLDEWRVMASRRAASLFTLALKTGGLLAGASGLELGLLEEAGVHIGYSFDIQDDIIDTFASEEQYGRAPGGDLAQGKRPLHV